MGGALRGGFLGASPRLDRLDSAGNLVFTTDFRAYFAGLARASFGEEAGRALGAITPLALTTVNGNPA